MILCTNSGFAFLVENNGLLFLETSALDSTNVELAFETVLKGKSLLPLAPLPCFPGGVVLPWADCPSLPTLPHPESPPGPLTQLEA